MIKLKRRKKGVRNERIGTLCNRNNRGNLIITITEAENIGGG